MSNLIETLDRRRRNDLRWYLIGFVAFFAAWIPWLMLRNFGKLPAGWNKALILVLVASVAVQAFFALRLAGLNSRIKKDPQLREALLNELVRHHEIRAWRFGFIVMASCLALYGLLSMFTSFHDVMGTVLTAVNAGFGGYQLSFFFMEKD